MEYDDELEGTEKKEKEITKPEIEIDEMGEQHQLEENVN
jgi:hypothetical protein